ncbi:hypothetical protein E3T55_19850 [Cryobacterium frigoriphilum]|uniref:Uncharacterized protein n=1 Tax=Cryobacterium frigoriphilum TaxID=1259150 RepID=A0A4R8ZT51_9MICO|nr:hypothetical protein [Cryobacterium frigoriphilum]TFD44816.1 hypothetical protein E3T55_19850 [Cryobacterium frigoriphilum]
MTLYRTEQRTGGRFTMSPFVALLALAMTLLGFFAIHSEVTGHDMHTPVSMSSVTTGAVAETGAPAVVAPDSAVMAATPHDGALDCALLAMACVLLLVLVTVVVLRRRPAVFHRLLDAGGAGVGVIRLIAVRVHRPSLVLLSISRV